MSFTKVSTRVKNIIKFLLLSILNHANPGCRAAKAEPDLLLPDDFFRSGREVTFVHCGDLGDILFSLHFCREISAHYGYDKFAYFIKTSPEGLSCSAAEFLLPLLETQDFISHAAYGEKVPENSVDLTAFRKLKLNFSSGDIRTWYYNLSRTHLPGDFSRPVLTVEANSKYQDKILICNTARYNNIHLDLSQLEKFREKLVFIGLPEEHREFCRKYFDIPFQFCKDMLEMAQFMAGSGGFAGNQSGIFSLAECLKIPRILFAPEFIPYCGTVIPGPHNNHPQGGWHEDAGTNAKMIAAMEALLEDHP